MTAEDWTADERLWIESYASMFPAKSFEAARAQVDSIIALTGFRGGTILDLACGPGRHAVPFATRGFAVTGVDRTPFLLDKAREYASASNATVELVEQDMRTFVRPEAFDLAVSMFTSFGFFEDHAENQRVLDNVKRSLRPGGSFIVDVAGKEVLARVWQPAASDEVEDGRVLIQRREAVDDWSRIEVEWLYLSGETVSYRKTLRHWVYSARELRLMLEAAGFGEVRTYGDLGGAPYGPAAKRLIAVARKP